MMCHSTYVFVQRIEDFASCDSTVPGFLSQRPGERVCGDSCCHRFCQAIAWKSKKKLSFVSSITLPCSWKTSPFGDKLTTVKVFRGVYRVEILRGTTVKWSGHFVSSELLKMGEQHNSSFLENRIWTSKTAGSFPDFQYCRLWALIAARQVLRDDV